VKAISQARKEKSGCFPVILNLLPIPVLSEEAEKTDAQERTEGRVRIRITKVLNGEAA
jgi:hypothetical protein